MCAHTYMAQWPFFLGSHYFHDTLMPFFQMFLTPLSLSFLMVWDRVSWSPEWLETLSVVVYDLNFWSSLLQRLVVCSLFIYKKSDFSNHQVPALHFWLPTRKPLLTFPQNSNCDRAAIKPICLFCSWSVSSLLSHIPRCITSVSLSSSAWKQCQSPGFLTDGFPLWF